MSGISLAERVLDHRYQLEERIGGGGMGEVYRGRHLMMDQRVAVKILRPDVARDANAGKRFVREARRTFRLDHPNCVRVTDLGATDDGLMYLVMEYLDGRTVAQELACDGPLAAGRVIHIGVQICAALAAAHDLGLIHRDLKPENLMLVHKRGDADAVKVLDFGLAKIITDPRGAFITALSLASLTREGMIFGTPAYMSPEQAVDDTLTPRSDLYTLGVVLYEMLTGALPFDSPNHMEILAAHVNQAPVPPDQRRLDLAIPPALAALVVRLMAKQPAERPESARAVATELEYLATTGSSPVRPAVPADVASSSTVDMDSDEIARVAGDARPDGGDGRAEATPSAAQAVGGPERRATRRVLVGLSMVAGVALVAVLIAISGGAGEGGGPRATVSQGAAEANPVTANPAAVANLPAANPADANLSVANPADANPPDKHSRTERSDKSGRGDDSSPRNLSEEQTRLLEAHLEQAGIARAAGNVLEQMAHADSALRIAPDHARAAYLLGDALLGSDRARACRYLKKARRKLAAARESYRRAGCGRAD